MTGPLRGNADFRRYWVGQLASDLGSQLSLVAYPLLVLAAGGTPAQAGGIATASLVVRMACRLPAGVLVDRFDRRRTMLAADLLRAAALGTVPLAALVGGPSYLQLLAVAVVEGAASSVFWPAAAVAVRRLVPPEQLTDALARSKARGAAVALIGPALGGWLFTVNRLVPFLGDAVSYVVSAVHVSRIRTPLPPGAAAKGRDVRILAGLRWLLGERVLRNVYAYAGVVNMTTGAAILATVVTAKQRGEDGTVIGLILAAVGAGGVLGTIIAPAVIRRLPAPAVFFAVGALLTGALGVLSVAASAWLVGATLAAAMLLSPAASILVGKVMLLRAPKDVQGRAAVASDLLISGPAAAGPLTTGFLLGGLGATGTWLTLTAVTGLATLAAVPTFRTPGFLSDPAPAPAQPPEPVLAGPAEHRKEETHGDI
jgi:MFS family permease